MKKTNKSGGDGELGKGGGRRRYYFRSGAIFLAFITGVAVFLFFSFGAKFFSFYDSWMSGIEATKCEENVLFFRSVYIWLRDDDYYYLALPLSVVPTFILYYFNYLGFKLYIRNGA